MKNKCVNRWLRYLLYAVVLVGYIFIFRLFEQSNIQFRLYATLNNNYLYVVALLCLGFGLILGAERLIHEIRKKKAPWQFNLPRFLFLGIPPLIISILAIIDAATYNSIFRAFAVNTTNYSEFGAVLFGYVFVSNFRRKKAAAKDSVDVSQGFTSTAKTWIFYLCYGINLAAYIMISGLLLNLEFWKFISAPFILLASILIFMVFGYYMSYEYLYFEKLKKKAPWRFNVPRFVLIGAPTILIALIVLIAALINPSRPSIYADGYYYCALLSAIVFGYIIISNFTRRKVLVNKEIKKD